MPWCIADYTPGKRLTDAGSARRDSSQVRTQILFSVKMESKVLHLSRDSSKVLLISRPPHNGPLDSETLGQLFNPKWDIH